MAAVATQLPGKHKDLRKKRKFQHSSKTSKPKKRVETAFNPGTGAEVKNSSKNGEKIRKLIKRKEKEYSSEVSDYEEENEKTLHGEDDEEEENGSQDEGDGEARLQGITKFTEGCRAFKMAFATIMKKSVSSDALGPILSAHKKLVVEKLADEVAEQKVKGEAKKEKHLAGEKGHVKPDNFLDSKEKFLISVATKGVVKLFNAVNKAQNPQKGLNPSRSKDAKVLAKRRKENFLSELHKSTNQARGSITKVPKLSEEGNSDEPGWAPLRDSYMLTSSKLKDWDKMPLRDSAAAVFPDKTPLESSSSDEE